MNRKVTISVKALVFGGLCVILLFVLGLELVHLHGSLKNAQLIFQVQQNSQNIQALDRAIGELQGQIEEIKKGK
jgi:Tfp pilus assembly protein PilN